MEKLGISVLCLALAALFTAYDNCKIKRKYDSLKSDHERLKNEIKLLQQENFYLKQISRVDTYTER